MHRAESIMQAIQSTLTGLATTGASVERSRVYPSLSLPALTLSQGRNDGQMAHNSSSEDSDIDGINRALEVNITSHIAQSTDMESSLNQIATEVFEALMSDRSLGLSYVFDVILQQDDEPDISKSPTVSQRMTWIVTYEHSNTSTEI